MPVTFYEFFCGGGMGRAGLGAGWRCMMANDNDAKKAASYVAHWSRDGLIVADVASLTTADLPGVIALALASPPCKGASLAGKRKGLGPEAWAFMGLMHGLRSEGRAPKMIVIENVLAMLTSNDGRDFDRLCSGLDNMGYHYGVVMIDAAAIVADRPSMPFHSEDVVKALRRQPFDKPRSQPIWWPLPVPPPHSPGP